MKGMKKLEEQKEETKKKASSKKKKIVIISIIIIILICFIFSVIFALCNSWNNNIIKGVAIEGIDVSNYSKEEIVNKLTNLIEENKTKTVVIKYQDVEKTITPEDLELNFDIETAATEAYLVGRGNNIFVNNFEIVQSFVFNRNIDINYSINEEKLEEIINSFNETLPGAVKEYEYCIEDDELIITKGEEGIAVVKDSLIQSVKDALTDFSTKTDIIEAPVENVKPQDIDLEKIHSEIYKEAQDAYISQDPITVHPNVNGVDFAISMEEAKELLKEDKEEYIIPLKITVAEKTLSDLGAEAFPSELGSYSTKFNVSNTNRTTNIKLATDKINGTIVMPGETFSYNQTVGKRTIEAGYKEAGAYAGGEVVQEVGGGICQVSSTLYNAVLYANLEIVERHNHHFETSYVPASRDATVSWGTLDFKFKNNRSYPIKIVASSKNGVESVSIYGIEEETEYEIILQSKKISTIYRETKYVKDDTIENGQEIVTQNGHEGCVSEAYKIVRLNGETISSTLLSRDKYYALDRIIKIGTKATVQEEEPQDEVVTEEDPETNVQVNDVSNNQVVENEVE